MKKKIIKVRLPAETVEIDLAQWALSFGLEPTAATVREDVVAYFAGRRAEIVESLGLGK